MSLSSVLSFIGPKAEMEVELLDLTNEQVKKIKRGYMVYVLEKKEFLPRIFAVGLSSDTDRKNIKDKNVIIRDITSALILANHDVVSINVKINCPEGLK